MKRPLRPHRPAFVESLESRRLFSAVPSLTSDIAFSPSVVALTQKVPLAATVTIQTHPTSAVAGQNFSTLTVEIRDSQGNILTDTGTLPVTLTATSLTGNNPNPGIWSAQPVNGVATFTGVAENFADQYSLTASFDTLTSPAITPFVITPAPATKLSFLSQPSPNTPGHSLGTIQIAITDPFNNITPDTTSITLSDGATPLATVSAVNGIATFSNLTASTLGSHTFTASATNLTSATSSPFTIPSPLPATLTFSQPPTDTTAGLSLSPITLQIKDQFGNLLTGAGPNITVQLATNPSGAYLAGTLTLSTNNGVATFSNLSLTIAGSYSLLFTTPTVAPATSSTFTITPAAPAGIAFLSHPSTAVASFNPAGLQVQVIDAFGNRVTSSTASITLAAGGVVNPTVAAIAGVATFIFFSGSYLTAGSYNFTASLAPFSSVTTSIIITPTSLYQLVIDPLPTPLIAGQDLGPSLRVTLEDRFGNIAGDDNSPITLSLSGPSSITPLTASAVNGVATFSSLLLTTSGNYTLTATAGTITSVPLPFTISPGTLAGISFSSQPTSAPPKKSLGTIAVHFVDSFGNTVPSSQSPITLYLGNFPLSTQSALNGVATFSNLSISALGTYTLTASSSGFPSVHSHSFFIANPKASSITFTSQPTPSRAGDKLPPITLQIKDQFGNPFPLKNTRVTLTPSHAKLLGPTTALTSKTGSVTFKNLSLRTAGTYTLRAHFSSFTATSTSFAIRASTLSKLILRPLPILHANTLFSLSFTSFDAYNNPLPTDPDSLTLKLIASPKGALLTGTLSSRIALSKAGAYTLLVTGPNKKPSLTFKITVH